MIHARSGPPLDPPLASLVRLPTGPCSICATSRAPCRALIPPGRRGGTRGRAAGSDAPDALMTGFVFAPFAEVEPQLRYVDALLGRGDVATSVG